MSDDQAYGVAAGELRQFIERVEQLEAEKKDIADQIGEVFAEMKGRGFDVKAVRTILKERRQNPDDVAEHKTLLNLYLDALGMAR